MLMHTGSLMELCKNLDAEREKLELFKTRLASCELNVHLNHESLLPPTDTPLLILIPSSGTLLAVKRTSHVSNREHELEYVTENGTIITGRYHWTYP